MFGSLFSNVRPWANLDHPGFRSQVKKIPKKITPSGPKKLREKPLWANLTFSEHLKDHSASDLLSPPPNRGGLVGPHRGGPPDPARSTITLTPTQTLTPTLTRIGHPNPNLNSNPNRRRWRNSLMQSMSRAVPNWPGFRRGLLQSRIRASFRAYFTGCDRENEPSPIPSLGGGQRTFSS